MGRAAGPEGIVGAGDEALRGLQQKQGQWRQRDQI